MQSGPTFVHFIPIATTAISIPFAITVLRRYFDRKTGPHLAWWGAGILLYGVGTLTESLVTLLGWQEPVFRTWYIAGALLGGAPLAQGTVYLLLSRRTANILSALLVPLIAVASIAVLLTPINYALVESHRLTGSVMEWTWVRMFSPFINTYAFVFLVGGAVLSAVRFSRMPEMSHRFYGNTLIAIGALLPGIGGMSTRMGYTEVLYVMEFVGLVVIWFGYRMNIRKAPSSSLLRSPAPATS